MSSLSTTIRLRKLSLKSPALLYTVVRNHWNKDYKPAKFPTTFEERAAAAEKYNLLPAEYKPYPDDGAGLGDYPNLPAISADSKDSNYPWDNPELKRNFGEPMHADFDLMSEDRYDVSFRHRVPLWKQFAQTFGFLFGTFTIYYLLQNVKMFPARLPKQYPLEGKTHYTFESK